jgi:hypothetical protein
MTDDAPMAQQTGRLDALASAVSLLADRGA